MDILCIIPARGGSKSIPRKNILDLAGKPLIAHTIESARNSKHITRIVVSTDDIEIAEISKHFQAEVVYRPTAISHDNASSESALIHTLNHLEETEGYQPDLLVFLQCTSPLTQCEDIDGTIDTLLNDKADSALSVTPFHYFLWERDEFGNATGLNHHKDVRILRQNQKPQYLETGSVYVMKVTQFQEAKHRFFGKTTIHIIPHERTLEIDEPHDFRVAEAIMSNIDIDNVLPHPVKGLVLDFDGVFTDNRVLVFEDGSEAVFCNRSDGHGLSEIKSIEIPILVLSTEINPVVQARCSKLGIECIHGVPDKLPILENWLRQNNIDEKETIYVGNDVNDLTCIKTVGCGIAVNDAHPAVKSASQIILESPGGLGAVREVTELIKNNLEKDR